MKKYFTIFLPTTFAMLLISCGTNTNQQQHIASTIDTVNTNSTANTKADTMSPEDITRFKYDKLIGNIPIPFDILRFHAEVPLSYNQVAINPPASVVYYSSLKAKALNLGIYGADMAYCITYKRFDLANNYLKCAKKLADELGIPLAFDHKTLAACEKYSTNKDSLEKIVYHSYAEVDKSLKSNERISLATLVVAGGWLEGLYATLTTLGNVPKNKHTAALYSKIREQKNYLAMIITTLNQFTDNQSVADIIADLNNIESVYRSFPDSASLSETEITALTQKVGVVRSKVISH